MDSERKKNIQDSTRLSNSLRQRQSLSSPYLVREGEGKGNFFHLLQDLNKNELHSYELWAFPGESGVILASSRTPSVDVTVQ